ncbi:hypothetical protein PR202_ga30215 [Eleusine coracana subsp. coracana]|uniref:rRNA N-glycosylase n=1 Tax=Eleusine coracana subsp. coracana TaxID=191504 RepID=A0AAV5DNE0_ELECO|nr:hypothetical protein QOZ80_4BG0359980 [Eleusine coracana subsp. coracana]GJN11975.1 hypothetical protein PR202_ga30215 [Eleusine coracana subsp. coracana]
MDMEGSSMSLLSLIVLTLITTSNLTVSLAQSPWEQLIVFPLQGLDGDVVRLAMTQYDLSIAGFSNRTGHWHAFPEHVARIPKSTPLRFGNSYHDLIGGLANLPSLPLGKEPMAQSAGVLSYYDPGTAADDEDAALKRALATLRVTTTEVQRLTPIEETVEKGWENGDARVDPDHLPYIEHWDTICHEIIRAEDNDGVWDGPFTELLKKKANIHSLEDALSVVSVIGDRTMEHVLMAHARSA